MIGPGDVVLVTGASSGLGLSVARAASARGADVVLVARGRSGLYEAAMLCAMAGARSTQVLPADVGERDEVAAVVERAMQRYGRIDAVVSAAGVIACGRFEDIPAEVSDGVVRTNLLGSLHVARCTLPVLRSQGAGTLVLIGSLVGHVPAPYVTPYVVSKWGVRALARQLRTEVRGLPEVRVGYVAPGGIDTPIYQSAADYIGCEVRPPLPVLSPERVARQVLDLLDGRHRRLDLGFPHTLLNGLARALAVGLPARAYDAVVRGLADVGGVELSRPRDPGPGNVLEPVVPQRREHGAAGSMVGAVARNAATVLRRQRWPIRRRRASWCRGRRARARPSARGRRRRRRTSR